MDDQPSSGNRWEPERDRPVDHADTAPITPQSAHAGEPIAPPPATTAPVVDGEGPVARRRLGVRRHLTRRRAAAAGEVAASFLVGGAGGYAVAHAVSADDAGATVPGQSRDVHDDGLSGDDHRHDLGGPGGTSPGQPGQPGQVPGQVPGQGSDDEGSGTSRSSSEGSDT